MNKLFLALALVALAGCTEARQVQADAEPTASGSAEVTSGDAPMSDCDKRLRGCISSCRKSLDTATTLIRLRESCNKSGVKATDVAVLDAALKDLPKSCEAGVVACRNLDVKATKLVAQLAADVRACDP